MRRAPSVYEALDIVAYPTASEGFGRIVIEAGAARRALVVTELDVFRELLSPGMEDLIVPRAADALARRIIEFATDAHGRESAAARLHDYVCGKFSLEAYRDQLLNLYRELLPAGERGGP